ncbi:MAG: T9SS type A sorting domain-containing protein [bacterium]
MYTSGPTGATLPAKIDSARIRGCKVINCSFSTASLLESPECQSHETKNCYIVTPSAEVAKTEQPKTMQPSVYPNPFNPSAEIRFILPETGEFSARIYDANGRIVRTWSNERRSEGKQKILWNGKDQAGRFAASGIYFAEIQFGKHRELVKMTLLR